MDKRLNEEFYGIKNTKNYIKFNAEKNTWHWIQVSLLCIIKIAISIIAMYLVWDCSSQDNIILRVIYTLIAALSAEFYIIYYAIYRVFLGNKCY